MTAGIHLTAGTYTSDSTRVYASVDHDHMNQSCHTYKAKDDTYFPLVTITCADMSAYQLCESAGSCNLYGGQGLLNVHAALDVSPDRLYKVQI